MPRISRGQAAAIAALALTAGGVVVTAPAAAVSPDARLSNDATAYTSVYTQATGLAYTDPALTECSRSRGRQNEPSVAINPRDPSVIVGSSNDYCAVYDDGVDADGAPVPSGPIWLGYYRSTNGGTSFASSLVPGYPGDTSPYASRAKIRTASAGDPVLAWDSNGRLFAGAESSDARDGSKKTLGDTWVATFENPGGVGGNSKKDGVAFTRSVIVGKGAAAPDVKGKFNDKTAIEVDRTNSPCRDNVYFAWSRFTTKASNIYFSRSTDHGATFSTPANITSNESSVQNPEINVTGDGTAYLTWASNGKNGSKGVEEIRMSRSTNCGRTWSPSQSILSYEGYDLTDAATTGGAARDCGVLTSACLSGFSFYRADSGQRVASDQAAPGQDLYLTIATTVPGSEAPTGNTFGVGESGTGGQGATYLYKVNGATGAVGAPARVDPIDNGHQVYPDIAVGNGTVRVIWWDSRADAAYSPLRPMGNDAVGSTTAMLNVRTRAFNTALVPKGASTLLTSRPSNPNALQFGGRTVPFAGDYLWVDSVGEASYATWTDWRDTAFGDDPRTSNNNGAEVKQCRTQVDGIWTGDTCPRDGGLDQNIYGSPVS